MEQNEHFQELKRKIDSIEDYITREKVKKNAHSEYESRITIVEKQNHQMGEAFGEATTLLKEISLYMKGITQMKSEMRTDHILLNRLEGEVNGIKSYLKKLPSSGNNGKIFLIILIIIAVVYFALSK